MVRKFKDTMISASDFGGLVSFYENFWGVKAVRNDDFAMLVDRETKQSLCITNGPSVTATSPGFAVDDIEKAVNDVTQLGGKVIRRWEFSTMKGANCYDPEGNEIMIWQGEHK
jgi:predicted enzyme related to lactoylglutathione lyase